MKLFFTSVLLIAFSSACSIQHQTNTDTWPQELPPRSYFIEHHISAGQPNDTQEEYLLWVKRFYLGWELYRPGWLAASDDFIATLDSEHKKNIAKEKTTLIGQLIASEWAKNNQYRIINSRHLSIWGDALNHSIVNHEQLTMLSKILDDVKTLLNKELKPQQIATYRYYKNDNFSDGVSHSF